MTVTVSVILSYLLSLPAYYEDNETKQERRQRMTIVAEDVTAIANKNRYNWDPTLVAAIIVRIGWEETRFAKYVGEGRCAEGRYKCDPDKNGVPQSRTYYQLKKKACQKTWTHPEGSREEHKAATKCAFQRFVGAYYRCQAGYAGGFSGYRSTVCSWPPSTGRAYRLGIANSKLINKMNKENYDKDR